MTATDKPFRQIIVERMLERLSECQGAQISGGWSQGWVAAADELRDAGYDVTLDQQEKPGSRTTLTVFRAGVDRSTLVRLPLFYEDDDAGPAVIREHQLVALRDRPRVIDWNKPETMLAAFTECAETFRDAGYLVSVGTMERAPRAYLVATLPREPEVTP